MPTEESTAGLHRSLDPYQEIASDQLDMLRENPGRCAKVSVHAGRHPFVRWNGEEYEIAERGHSKLEVTACEKSALLNLFAENPVDIRPVEDAMYNPPDPGTANVWEHAEERPDHVIYSGGDE